MRQNCLPGAESDGEGETWPEQVILAEMLQATSSVRALELDNILHLSFTKYRRCFVAPFFEGATFMGPRAFVLF